MKWTSMTIEGFDQGYHIILYVNDIVIMQFDVDDVKALNMSIIAEE